MVPTTNLVASLEHEADLLTREFEQQVHAYETEIAQFQTQLRDMITEAARFSDLVDNLQDERSTLVGQELELRKQLDLLQWSSRDYQNPIIKARQALKRAGICLWCFGLEEPCECSEF